jgi:hypothetical protein
MPGRRAFLAPRHPQQPRQTTHLVQHALEQVFRVVALYVVVALRIQPAQARGRFQQGLGGLQPVSTVGGSGDLGAEFAGNCVDARWRGCACGGG